LNVVRVAIAGAGYGAQVHLPAVLAAGGRVVACADGGSGRAAAAAAITGMRVFDDWRALLDWGGFDVLAVALPPALQCEAVSEALDAGCAVMCEKPFGLDLEQAEAMCGRLALRCGFGAVGFQFRYEPVFRVLRDALQGGVIGAIERIEVSWMTGGRADPRRATSFQHDMAQGGGVANAFLTHVIDYLAWITRAPLVDLRGRAAIIHAERTDAEGRSCRVTAEDMFDLLGRCGPVQVVASVSNCVRHGHGHRVVAFGGGGRIELGIRPPFRPQDVTLQVIDSTNSRMLPIPSADVPADTRLPAATALWRDCFAVLGGAPAPNLPRFADGLAMWRALAAAKRSAAMALPQ
jgi:predicted dehydrogenase